MVPKWFDHWTTRAGLMCEWLCVGPLSPTIDRMSRLQCIDGHVLVDALALVIGSEEKEFCTPCIVALALILKTAVSVLGSKEKVTGQRNSTRRLQFIGSRPSDHYFRSVCLSVCLFVCLFVRSFSQPSSI